MKIEDVFGIIPSWIVANNQTGEANSGALVIENFNAELDEMQLSPRFLARLLPGRDCNVNWDGKSTLRCHMVLVNLQRSAIGNGD